MDSAPTTWLHRSLWAAAIGAFVVMLCMRIQLIGFHEPDIGGIETFTIHSTQSLLLGQTLYPDPEHVPFCYTPISPLYYHLVAAFDRLLRVDPMEPHQVYVVGRVLCLFLNLLTLWPLWLIARRIGLSAAWCALICSLQFCSQFDTSFGRPDALYLLFFFLGMGQLLRAWDVPVGSRPWWSAWMLLGIIGVLGMFTKQTGILTFLIAGAVLMVHGRWRSLVLLGASALVTALLALVVLSRTCDLLLFYKNVVDGVKNGTSFAFFAGLLGPRAWPADLLMFFTIAVPVALLLRTRDDRARILSIATLVSLVFGLTTALKCGSNMNYITESQVFTFLLVPWSIHRFVAAPYQRKYGWFFVVFASCLLFFHVGQLFSATEISHYRKDDLAAYECERTIARRITALDPKAYELSNYGGYLDLFMHDHALGVEKHVITGCDDLHQGIDWSGIHRMIAERAIPFIVTQEPGPPYFNDREIPGYHLLFREGRFHVYVPDER